MVSLKRLFFFGVALVSAIPLDSLVVHEPGTVRVSRDVPLVNDAKHKFDIDVRQGPRRGLATLQWSPQGRIIFLAGLKFPQAVLDGFYGLGEGGPARGLFNQFTTWLHNRYQPTMSQVIPLLWDFASAEGGVYGKAGGTISDTYGFGIQTDSVPDTADLQALLEDIYTWASQSGEIVRVIARPNNYFDLGTIGAGEGSSKRGVRLEARSRGNQCPKETNLLQYATEEVPDIDINSQIRWAGVCDG